MSPNSINSFLERLQRPFETLTLSALEGSAPAWLVAKMVEKMPLTPLVCVVPTDKEAMILQENISYFCHKRLEDLVVDFFPSVESLPFSRLHPQPDVWINRLTTLHHVTHHLPLIVTTSVEGLLRRTLPKRVFLDHYRTIEVNDPIDRDELGHYLAELGYLQSPIVEDCGNFSLRGFITDIWSPLSSHPTRIEMENDRVISIRSFDPIKQRTITTQSSLMIMPVRNIIMNDRQREYALAHLKEMADEADIPLRERQEFAERIEAGRYCHEMESMLALFYEKSDTLLDYLPEESIILFSNWNSLKQEENDLLKSVMEAKANCTHIERMIQPEWIYSDLDKIKRKSGRSLLLNSIVSPQPEEFILSTHSTKHFATSLTTKAAEDTTGLLADKLRDLLKTSRVVITCHTSLQAERTIDLLRWHGLAVKQSTEPFCRMEAHESRSIEIAVAPLFEGFIWNDAQLALLAESELFSKRPARRHTKQPISQTFLNTQDLNEGDYIVHTQHGIGRYLNMINMEIRQVRNDFIVLEYLGGDKLYLPAYRLNLVQKYIGPNDSSPALDKLGGTRWTKANTRIVREIRTMAGELLKIYAARQIAKGHAFSGRDHNLEEFEALFPFDETPDQWKAIEKVLDNMQQERPMDRLICGDVGYGKTEVAIRAAFRAAMDGKQVAVLVPTTILAFQHYQSFLSRFEKTAIRIALLNRFKSAKEQKESIRQLASHETDIIIGTHRLLSSDIKYADLGLLIIDEEHRFGVKQKEKIRSLKKTVDTMAMSATPIPRSLNMALSGIREISVINTPPVDRLAIRTYVAPFDSNLIRSAILRELGRNGQVFFVHNRVQTIYGIRDRLQRIIPEAKFIVAHGQMEEHELEKAMMEFLEKKSDVLICTSIIESGLDIPSANTIIINRADTFGLASLYQLRGRVGRSNIQAYAYLMIPESESVTAQAEKRLSTLQRYTELGSGFSIAMHDLEIRGAGNLLGSDQHGHIAEIGYELYTKLLERTIRQMRGEMAEEEIDPEVRFQISAFLPDLFIPEATTRMIMYKRLSQLSNPGQINDVAAEIEDRFGPMPVEVKNLLGIIEVKCWAKMLRIEQIQYDKQRFIIRFHPSTPLDPGRVLKMSHKQPALFQLKPNNMLVINHPFSSDSELFSFINGFLETLLGSKGNKIAH